MKSYSALRQPFCLALNVTFKSHHTRPFKSGCCATAHQWKQQLKAPHTKSRGGNEVPCCLHGVCFISSCLTLHPAEDTRLHRRERIAEQQRIRRKKLQKTGESWREGQQDSNGEQSHTLIQGRAKHDAEPHIPKCIQSRLFYTHLHQKTAN